MTTVQVIKKLLSTRGDRNDQLQIFTSRGREEEKKNFLDWDLNPGPPALKSDALQTDLLRQFICVHVNYINMITEY